MAVAGTYIVFPSELTSPLFGVREDVELAVVHHHHSSSSSAGKKLSRPFELLRWITTKSRRKEKDPASSPVATTVTTTAAGALYDDSRPYLDDSFTQHSILDADLPNLVQLPAGLDYNEWLATHTISFFEHINIVYGCVSEGCCQSPSCSAMVGPLSVQYQWVDERGKRTKCTASQYADYVMSFSHKFIYDEAVFPTKYGNLFPSTFESTVKKIHRLLLHVLAHIYQCHWQLLVELDLHGHVNTLAYHFLLFNKQFSLVDDKELEVLDDFFLRLQYHASCSRRKVVQSDVDSLRSLDDCSSVDAFDEKCLDGRRDTTIVAT